MQRSSFTTQTCAQNTICRLISEAVADLVAAQNAFTNPRVQIQGVTPEQLNELVLNYNLARYRLDGMLAILNEVTGLTPETIVHINQARLVLERMR